MTREQAVNILSSLIKTAKLTEDERNLCYEAIRTLNKDADSIR